jgi:hypothetical protein
MAAAATAQPGLRLTAAAPAARRVRRVRQDGDGLELVGFRQVGVEHGGSAGLRMASLHAGIGFGGETPSSVSMMSMDRRRGELGDPAQVGVGAQLPQREAEGRRSMTLKRISRMGRSDSLGDQVLGALRIVPDQASVSRTSGPSRPVLDPVSEVSDDGELAVVLDLADQHRLGDVVVRQHRGSAAGQVGGLTPTMASMTAGSVVPAFSTALTHMLKPM